MASVAEQRTVRAQVAGVATKSPAGNDAEGFQAQSIRNLGHELVKFEAGGLGVFLKFRPQQEVPAESWQVGCGHGKNTDPGALAVAQAAIDLSITLRPPALENFGCPRQYLFTHVRLALLERHLRPGQAFAIGSRRPDSLWVAGGTHHGNNKDDNKQYRCFHFVNTFAWLPTDGDADRWIQPGV